MFKYIIFNIIGLIVFICTLTSYNSVIINEEVNPIRDKDIITSMDYKITINKKTNKKSFSVNTSILSSVYHYKDINNINEFFVNIKLVDYSKYKYHIDSVLLVDKDYIIREISMDKKHVFVLKKEDFNSDYSIRIIIKK